MNVPLADCSVNTLAAQGSMPGLTFPESLELLTVGATARTPKIFQRSTRQINYRPNMATEHQERASTSKPTHNYNHRMGPRKVL